MNLQFVEHALRHAMDRTASEKKALLAGLEWQRNASVLNMIGRSLAIIEESESIYTEAHNEIVEAIDEQERDAAKVKEAHASELFWRVMAVRAVLGEATAQDLANAAFRGIIGVKHDSEQLREQLTALIDKLESFEEAQKSGKELRSIRLDHV
jgi:hypothetical protein